jgi:O-antigen ligase
MLAVNGKTNLNQELYKYVVILIAIELLLLCISILFPKVTITLVFISITLLLFIILLYYPISNIIIILFSLLGGNLSSITFTQKLPSIYFIDIAITMVLIIMFIKVCQEGTLMSFNLNSLEWIFLFFIIWCFITNALSIDPIRGMAYLRYIIGGWFVFLLCNRLFTNKYIVQKTLFLLMIWGTLLCFMQLYFLSTRKNIIIALIGKDIHLPIGSSNYIAAFYVLLIPLAIAFLQIPNLLKKYRVYLTLNVILMLSCLLLTGSRGGVVGLFGGSCLWLTQIKKKAIMKKIIIIFIIIGIVLYLNPSTRIIWYNFSKIKTSASVFSRVGTWQESIRIFENHPIIGIGLGNMHYYVENYLVKVTGNYTLVKAHNLILELLVETGIIGFSIFFILLFCVFRSQFKLILKSCDPFANRIAKGAFIANVCVLLHSMFEPTILTYFFGIVFWMLIALSNKKYHHEFIT